MSEDESRAVDCEVGDNDGESRGLDGAQAAIRDACFGNEAGLFVLACGPGAGKSYTADRVGAEALARAANDDLAPTETVCLTSFSRDDAASILPGVEDALSELAGGSTSTVDPTPESATHLARQLRASDRVGTVDGVLLSVFEHVASAVGFDNVPTVGDGAGLALTRGDAMTAIRENPRLAAPLARLEAAYPAGRYDADVATLLADAQVACRERRLSVDEFRDRLEAVVDATYPDGTPSSAADVLRDVARFAGSEERTAVERSLADDQAGRSALVSADAELHSEWKRTIAAFCEVLSAYVDAYDGACRANGVVSHVDVAHWVATYFEADEFDHPFRDRLRARYTDRLSTVVVDEAQDVSQVQHDAFAPLVDSETRVFLVGDLQQCIYAWRNAQPKLFERAYRDGVYFDIDWETHEATTEQRTHRCLPGVSAGLDRVFRPIFEDDARGAAGTFEVDYEPLNAVRDEVDETTRSNIHVAVFDGEGRPGSRRWVSPRTGGGEADALAECLASGLADGRFASEETPDPGVTVLFQRRTFMADYADAFEKRGLSVRDASRSLFDHPLVEVVTAVCSWLRGPTETQRTMTLLNDDSVELAGVVHRFAEPGADVHSVAERQQREPESTFLTGLSRLARRRDEYVVGGGAALVGTVVDELELESDPFDQCDATTDPVAVCDRLVSVVESWEGGERYSLAQTVAALTHATDGSGAGPGVPTTSDPDVTFRTIHDAKGDEDDVVAVADLGEHVQHIGTSLDRFLAHGHHLALAPPANLDLPDSYPDLDDTLLASGLYDPSSKPGDLRAGLRWASERWLGPTQLAGPEPLAAAGSDARAERWRLLFVACSRARDHLVVPLPETRADPEPRDRWCDAIRDGLAFDATRGDSYTLPATAEFDSCSVSVHRPGDGSGGGAETHGLDDGRVPPLPNPVREPGWTPRFCNPSTLHPLSSAPETYVLDHLQNRPLHADHDGLAPDLPLGFETMGPDVVGTVTHAVVARALEREADTETLRACTGSLATVLDDAIAREARGVRRDEQELLRAFVADTVCPQLADSALWDRLAESDVVHVEEPLDAVVRRGDAGLPVELGGQADVVSIDAAGRWRVDDVKVTLQPTDEAIRTRYDLQTAAYAWVLGGQQGVDSGATVVPCVTTLGVETGTRSVELGADDVLAAIDSLVERRGLPRLG